MEMSGIIIVVSVKVNQKIDDICLKTNFMKNGGNNG